MSKALSEATVAKLQSLVAALGKGSYLDGARSDGLNRAIVTVATITRKEIACTRHSDGNWTIADAHLDAPATAKLLYDRFKSEPWYVTSGVMGETAVIYVTKLKAASQAIERLRAEMKKPLVVTIKRTEKLRPA